MRLEYVEALPQGTPVFEVETGLKDCANPGAHLPRCLASQTVCPGCCRVCAVPSVHIQPGQHFVVRKRPKKKEKR